MSRGLLFLLWRSAWGRMVRAVRRLREPRYLVGFIVGGGWMLFWVSRAVFRSGRGSAIQVGLPPELLQTMAGPTSVAVQLAVCAVLLIILGIWWLVPFGKHALEFSEAELHLLLPAPVPRRHIFEYAILRSQVGILVGCAIVTIFSGARDPLTMLPRFAGVWILFTIWDLHSKGRSLWLAGLAERTAAAAWSRRIGVAVAILAAWALLAAGAAQVGARVLPELGAIRADAAGWLRDVLPGHVEAARHGILGWVLAPLVWLTAPAFIGIRSHAGPLAVAGAWIMPVIFLLLHNEWVVRSQARFEEAALARARRKSRKADPAARFWRSSDRNRVRTPFRLAATGAPEIALIWKNLMLTQRLSLRTLVGGGAILVLGALALVPLPGVPALYYGVLLMAAAILMLLAPLMSGRSLRNDLRADLLKIETIRPWPLRPARLVAAEIAAPVLLTSLQCLLGATLMVGLSLLDTLGLAPYALPAKQTAARFLGAPESVLIPIAVLAYAPVAIAVAALASGLENVAALLFPSWVHLGLDKKAAAAKFGQNMIVFLALSIAMLFGLTPGALAVAAFVAVQTLLWGIPLSIWELPLLGLLGAAPIMAVVVALIGAGGRLWDRLDPSQELLTGKA